METLRQEAVGTRRCIQHEDAPMVGVSVCHHVGVGIREGRQPCWSCVVFSKCELQARGELCSCWEKREDSLSAAARGKKAQFVQ
ncbi:hypothetical protein Y1Q_0003766 [Alligator mississippiensis]|uniref:Uncharacterized protein n=1 Tax=Alligator mississippiensis TaxID=8496 RepID=A0A151MNM4_ALLMI|nr:hypothetical protein Y1Q_0003766 [Alligator mississippiensis]